ncbi:hypothetical protein AB6A40_010084 [Gnathostoma spinigerum]|uniref:Uncharacterized protein n=1 Tax=Gnathostoma spinigerum TaxID=75299 RepID=A0ABD6ETS3_9BILA
MCQTANDLTRKTFDKRTRETHTQASTPSRRISSSPIQEICSIHTMPRLVNLHSPQAACFQIHLVASIPTLCLAATSSSATTDHRHQIRLFISMKSSKHFAHHPHNLCCRTFTFGATTSPLFNHSRAL